MSKRLAKSTITKYVIALLLLTGWGVQAVQVVAMENAAPQANAVACCQTVDSVDEGASSDDIADCADHASQDCGMNARSCHSGCMDCPAAIGDAPAATNAIDRTLVVPYSPAAIAALDPIDHPPKRLSSL